MTSFSSVDNHSVCRSSRQSQRHVPAAAGMLLLLLLASVNAGAQTQLSIDSLDWIAGQWVNDEGSAVQEEYWMAPSGKMMPGLHRDVTASGKAFFEYLRIVEKDGALFYHARPGGGAETVFRADSISFRFVRFINAEHDFPQRIQYALDESGALVAEISDAQGGNVQRWVFRRKK